ncbi:MAG: shikimate kinase [Pseudomonadota bacterium]
MRVEVNRPESNEIGEDAAAELRRLAAGLKLDRTVALVGLMGAGKTTVGRRLAAALRLPFLDADQEIERAAGLSVKDIFATYGEPEFRRGEREVICRLLRDPPMVLATGGGAFMDAGTRAKMKQTAITVWLKAPLDVLIRRVERRDERPLLKGDDPQGVMKRLLEQREPIYAEADITVESTNSPHNAAVIAILDALRGYAAKTPA